MVLTGGVAVRAQRSYRWPGAYPRGLGARPKGCHGDPTPASSSNAIAAFKRNLRWSSSSRVSARLRQFSASSSRNITRSIFTDPLKVARSSGDPPMSVSGGRRTSEIGGPFLSSACWLRCQGSRLRRPFSIPSDGAQTVLKSDVVQVAHRKCHEQRDALPEESESPVKRDLLL